MPQFGGKRGQSTEAEIVQRGGEKVADLTVQKGAAEGAKYGALGQAIGGTAEMVGQGLGRMRERAEDKDFEREKIGAQMEHETALQREKVMGESALQKQGQQGRQEELRMELQARKEENDRKREFEMANEGKTTFDPATGHYASTPLAQAQRVADYNLTQAKRRDVLADIGYKAQKLDQDMQIANEKMGMEKEEHERKAIDGFTKHIEDLGELERKALADASRGSGGSANPFTKGQTKSAEESLQLAEQMRAARNKQAFHLASKTGDTSYIVPGSKEQMLMTNRWIPMARRILNNSPLMQDMALRQGMGWADRTMNKLAAQLTMAELADPDIAAAMAKAMMDPNGSAQPSGQPPGGAASQPGQQSPGQRPGGISIPRGR